MQAIHFAGNNYLFLRLLSECAVASPRFHEAIKVSREKFGIAKYMIVAAEENYAICIPRFSSSEEGRRLS